ncbi:MAG: hypothetical protein H8E44_29730 [Planctomycetes bacterium]|nr:hypothetical protein [Planctomycetota bacterium]
MNTRAFLLWAIAVASFFTLPGHSTQDAFGADSQLSGLVVNPDTQTNDSKPSLAVLADGSTWMAWHAYSPGRDRICARRMDPDGLGPILDLSQDGTIHDAPCLVAAGDNGAWVFWSAMLDGRWRLTGRRFAEGRVLPAVTLSVAESDALMPAAACLGNDRPLLAWSDRQDGCFCIRSRTLDGDVWEEPIAVSSGEHDAFRPVVVAAREEAWVVWDEYRDGNYAVWARQLSPELGPAEQVSPPGQNCMRPAALLTSQGLAIAWVRSTDIENDSGAIGQIHTLRVALRKGPKWQIICDGEGDPTAATLVHGLTARMKPKPAGKWGHMARLRVPMLLEAPSRMGLQTRPRTLDTTRDKRTGLETHPTPNTLEDGRTLWLLWERKTNDSAHPARSLADLAARPCRDGQWGDTVIVQSKMLDYRLSTAPRTDNGTFALMASDLPRGGRRIYHLLECDLYVHKPFHQDPWTGYRPVTLPLQDEEQPPRHEIRMGEKTYQLYWIDLHNHSGLTCDAHGEPDELFHYARDRARIDAMALADNDEVFDDPLTEAEYALGAFFARHFTEDGHFIGLPGYEWTSHVPNANVQVDRSDPRCWDFRWFPGRCHSNHRTVIYPPSGGPILRHTEIGNNIEQMFETVARHGGVVFPHHGSWDITGHPVEVGAEVTSAWHICFNAGLLHRVLNAGHRMGFAGNSDSHRRQPGLGGALTAVYAEALTGHAILEALHNRRFYATNGSWIVLDSRANGSLIGQQVEAPDGVAEIALTAIGTRPIVSATLVGDGRELKTFSGTGQREFHAQYRTKPLDEGTHWFYWRIAQEGTSPQFPGNVCVARGHLAWCSPHWVTVPKNRAKVDSE